MIVSVFIFFNCAVLKIRYIPRICSSEPKLVWPNLDGFSVSVDLIADRCLLNISRMEALWWTCKQQQQTNYVCMFVRSNHCFYVFVHFLVFPLMYIFQQPLYPKLIPKSESNLCNVFNRSLSCQFNTWSALIWTTHIFFFREHLVLRPRYLWRVFWSNCRQTKASNSWTCQPLGERPKWKN